MPRPSYLSYAVAALTLTVVMVLSGIVTSPVPASVPTATNGERFDQSPVWSQFVAYVTAHHSESEAGMAQLGSVPYSFVVHFVNAYVTKSTPRSELMSLAAQAIKIAPLASWGAVLQAAAGGCVLGAVVGGIAGAVGLAPGIAVGAAAGCVMGATALVISQSFETQVSQDTASKASATTVAAESTNEWKLINAQATETETMLPATAYFWYRLADIAAMDQIGSSNYNASADLTESTMVTQFGSISTSLLLTADNVLSEDQSFASSTGGCLEVENGGSFYCATPSSPALQDIGVYGSLYEATSVGAIMENGNGCAAAGATTFYGGHVVSATGGTCTGFGGPDVEQGLLPAGIYSSEEAPGINNAQAWLAAGAPWCVSGACTYALKDTPGELSSAIGDEWAIPYSGGQTGVSAITPLANITGMMDAMATLEVSAVTNGQVWWQYLRNLGYTSPLQIPPEYEIPPPFDVLPPTFCFNNVSIMQNQSGFCKVTLNESELESLYSAWLNSMYLFFNSSNYRNNGTFESCQQKSVGCIPWANLNTYAVGDIYVPGNKSEVLSNVSTWQYKGTQILLEPYIHSVRIPVGQRWEVPANDQFSVYLVQYGTQLNLAGNGTNVSVSLLGQRSLAVPHLVPLTSAAGDAVYLTYCSVNQQATQTCTASVITVNGTVTVLTCPTNASAGSTCPTPPTTVIFTLPNPFSAIASWLSSLFGGGTAFWGGIVEAVFVIVIVLSVLWVATKIGGKKAGGGTGTMAGGRR